MTTTVIANGNTYTDDSDPITGMGNGGFQTRLLPMLSDVMHDVNAALPATIANAAAAAASAASALSAPGTSGTSTTSATIGTGSVTLNIQTGKSIPVGASVKWANTASPSNWGHGDVLSYNSGTGDITINTTRTQGSGTAATWTVSLSGPAFADGAIGGAYVAPISADLALAANSPKLISIRSAANGGSAIILPDATTLGVGPFAMALKHNGPNPASSPGYDIPVKDHASNLLGFLQPFSYAPLNLSDNSTAAGGWVLSGLSPLGSLAAGKLTLASACGGTGGTWTKNVTLDSTRTCILIYGTSLHAVVYDSSVKLFGPPVLLRATLSTTGVDATVAAVLAGTNSVLVHSVQDGTTSLQSVVLSISARTITPGTVVSTTLGATASRIVDLVAVGTAWVLGYLNGTTSLHTLVTTVTGTVPLNGTEQVNTTVGPPAMIAWSATVFTVVTISATAITAKAYSIAGVVQTAGSTATSPVTTVDSFAMRLVATGSWCITCINTSAKGCVLTVSGTAPAIGAQVTLNSLVTTINAGGAVMNLSPGSNGAVSSAVSGTDSSGRFVTEFIGWGDSSGTPGTAGLIGSIVAKGFAAAQVVTALGNSANAPVWLATSAKETAMFSFSYAANANTLLSEYRTNALANSNQELSIPDPLYPKLNVARNTLGVNGSTSIIGVTDGSQPSVRYNASASGVEVLTKPASICADLRFASKAASDAQAWVAFNQAPDTSCTIQLMGVV